MSAYVGSLIDPWVLEQVGTFKIERHLPIHDILNTSSI